MKKPEVLNRITSGKHAVIEASAGTGKTFTLEHLVFDKIVTGQADIEEMLVVTFTEKAASELRQRIRAKLLQGLQSDTEETSEQSAWKIGQVEIQRLAEALHKFDRANISTIHSFCQKILTENAFSHNRLFKQELVDGRAAFDRSFVEVLRTLLAKSEDYKYYLESWLEYDHPDRLADLLY